MGRPRTARTVLPRHVHVVHARGREYFYYTPNRGTPQEGKRVPLLGTPFDVAGLPNEDWWQSYKQVAQEQEPEAIASGSFAALIKAYQASPDWRGLADKTRVDRARHLKQIAEFWGDLSVKGLEPKHVLELRDAYAETEAAANNLLRSLSSLLSWSIPRGWRTYNPCTNVKKFARGEGYRPWSMEDIDFFRERSSVNLWGVAAVALYSGQRQADVLKMLWTDIVDGVIAIRQNKTGKRLSIPIHEKLQAILDQLPRTAETVLTNTRGHPWTQDGFKTSWNKQLNQPEMKPLRAKRLVFHGLRKSAVVFLLEAGCSDAEVSAITGQTRGIVEHYAKGVNQKKLSASAVLKREADKPKVARNVLQTAPK